MPKITRISPPEAQKLIHQEGYVYLDVRSEPEYEAGHPAGAHNVPLMQSTPSGMMPNPDFLRVVQALYGGAAKLILGCRSGQRSMRAAEMMQNAGFGDLVELRPGFDGARDPFGSIIEAGWAAQGFPCESQTPGASYEELKRKAGI